MHEMSLMQNVLEIVLEAAENQGFDRVRKITLEIGDFSGVDPQAMEFCFDVVMEGSIAAGAALEIVRKPGEAWCMQCGRQVEISERFDPCPHCGSFGLKITGGQEMRVRELEVE